MIDWDDWNDIENEGNTRFIGHSRIDGYVIISIPKSMEEEECSVLFQKIVNIRNRYNELIKVDFIPMNDLIITDTTYDLNDEWVLKVHCNDEDFNNFFGFLELKTFWKYG